MISRTLAIAFHGCEDTLAKRLVNGECELEASANAYDWLGHGRYGWEDSPVRAWQWAHEAVAAGRIKNPSVVGMVIDLGHCLNLVDADSLRLVREAYSHYQVICHSSGISEVRNRGPEFKARFLDCAVLETLHASHAAQGLRPFDTVRGFFVEGSELYPGAGLRDRDHIQICVRNPKCVKGYFLPKD
jgi:hypothetical protein